MWSSIRQILNPQSFDEAIRFSSRTGSALLAGGSYLVRGKNQAVHTLVDIRSLLNRRLEIQDESLFLGAGATLQDIIDEIPDTICDGWLGKTAKWSCHSKNVRQQRTLGGEIATGRSNSDIYILLQTLDPVLQVFMSTMEDVPLHLWNGIGVITGMKLNLHLKPDIVFQRYSVLESSQSYLIVTACRFNDHLTVSIGGDCTKWFSLTVPAMYLNDLSIDEISKNSASRFTNDQNGSVAYKRYLIHHSLQQIRDSI